MPVGKGKEHAAEYRELVEILRSQREAEGLTQAELANTLGKPQSYVSKIERGKRLIDPVELRQLCDALGINVVDVVRRWTSASTR